MRSAGKPVGWGLWTLFVVILAGTGARFAWPHLFPGTLERGRVAYERGNWREAQAQARRHLDRNPDDRQALQLMARSSARLGQDETARTIYGRLKTGGMRAEDFFLLARGLLRNQQTELAWGALELAQKDDPNHPETLHEMARLLAQKDELEEATSLASKLAGLPGWEARGELALGLLRKEQSDPAGAATALKQALVRDPALQGAPFSAASVRKLLARALLEVHRPAEASAELQTVLASGPDPEASWLMSRAWLQEGSVDQAAASTEKAQGFLSDRPLAPEPAPFAGAARCAECHSTIYRLQQSSRHSKTFHRASELQDLPVPDHAVADPFDAQILHTLKHDGSLIRLETAAEGRVLRASIDYAFGSGDRGLTFVGRDEVGQSRELRLSHYNDGSGWDRTTGQPPQPSSPSDFLGMPLSARGVRLCLVCHTTDVRAARDKTGPAAADRGIGCEQCHGPGGNHLEAVDLGSSDLAIARPRLAPATQIVWLCGRCHSPRQGSVSRTDRKSVRFQATTLTWSSCYTQSSGSLSCVTCHDPHRDAETSDAFYEAKCLACHSAKPPTPSRSQGTRRVVLPEGVRRVSCPVSPAGRCIRCHMPTVKDAVPHSPFTDHQIRVHREATAANVGEKAHADKEP